MIEEFTRIKDIREIPDGDYIVKQNIDYRWMMTIKNGRYRQWVTVNKKTENITSSPSSGDTVAKISIDWEYKNMTFEQQKEFDEYKHKKWGTKIPDRSVENYPIF